MKINWPSVLYFWNVIAWAALIVFLADLAGLGSGGKNEDMWGYICHDESVEHKFMCMVDYDIVGILCAIFVLIFSTYKLAPIYKKQLIVTPLEGLFAALLGWPILRLLIYTIFI